MKSGFVRTVDGVDLYYEDHGEDVCTGHAPPIVLIHGWSGSSGAFVHNITSLHSLCSRVIVLDLRSHGSSQKVSHGAHVARLAADLNELLASRTTLPHKLILLGSSLGCAVIWSFVELFGTSRLHAAVFVDQAPFQNSSMDGAWRTGSNGIFSAESYGFAMGQLHADRATFMQHNARACLTREPTAHDLDVWGTIGLQADVQFLIALMGDHTAQDWRRTLPLVTCPALVVGPLESKIFPVEGVRACAELMPNAQYETIAHGSHWCYYEQPNEFNAIVRDFVRKLPAPSESVSL
mmetsp:Transcript_2223/g.5007  ORF Transcript_2223/g.5007 Transcript_2223/m.5007 type:complete len:293 (-) Transcript_2223:101-979(-)